MCTTRTLERGHVQRISQMAGVAPVSRAAIDRQHERTLVAHSPTLLGMVANSLRTCSLGADIAAMSKRALLQLFGWLAAGLTYLVAAGASGGVPSYVRDCVGLASLPHWFESVCSSALVPRLFVVGIGAIPTVLLFYFAEKEPPPTPSPRLGPNVARAYLIGREEAEYPPLVGGHTVRYKPAESRYKCLEPGCEFEVPGIHSRDIARQHRINTGGTLAARSGPAPVGNAVGFESPPASATQRQPVAPPPVAVPAPVTAAAQPSAAPEFKTCPDCAEDVKFAARKCRFCGFQFEAAGIR
jgi:uncharacterized membrane protein YhdT